MNNTRQIKAFIATMMLACASAAAYAGFHSHTLHPAFAIAVLALAAATSRMRVKLPGINGNMSVNLPFLLTAIVNLSAVEAMAIGCAATVVQCWPRKGTAFKPEQMTFNLSMMGFATCMASLVFHSHWLQNMGLGATVGLVLATVTLLLGQTVPVSAIVALSESQKPAPIWWSMAQLSFPYYVVSAGVTSMVISVSSHLGWELALAVFPVMYGIHCSYRLYFSKVAENLRTEVRVRAASAGA
ncbi:MAG TPA: hypothetical protein VKV39_18040 [Candidatus Sulfotelmatobacter sp.]|nr:hypothetical protein [Candidatus Sulfotelmatobacter sp.]